jgi:hypothetical protein
MMLEERQLWEEKKLSGEMDEMWKVKSMGNASVTLR